MYHNHHHNPDTEQFYLPKKLPRAASFELKFSYLPKALAAPDLFSVPAVLPFPNVM
jgi:hypothetical protein